MVPQPNRHHPPVQLVVVGLAIYQGKQRLVGLRITDVPLPLPFRISLPNQNIVMPQVAGSPGLAVAPGSSAHGVIAVGDVQAGLLDFDELAVGVEFPVFGGLANNANFSTQGVVFPFIVFRFDQAVVFNFAAFRDTVTAQVVSVSDVVFFDELALGVPLVIGVTGEAVDGRFQS